MIERVVAPPNLHKDLGRVVSNGGFAGVDRMSVMRLAQYLVVLGEGTAPDSVERDLSPPTHIGKKCSCRNSMRTRVAIIGAFHRGGSKPA
jgi:hypothetical protein